MFDIYKESTRTIFALLIGAARIFVGVHWPSNILVGTIIGLVSAFLVKKLLPKIS